MLELVLKYDPGLFARGALELQWSWGAYAAAVLGLALFAALATGYATRRGSTPRRRARAGLWALRTALLALLLFTLLDPRLVVEVDEPVRGHAAVLVDDSLSMRIRDLDGTARSAFVQRAFAPGAGSIATALEQRVDTRYLRFSNNVETLAPDEPPGFAGARSNLAGALRQVARGADAQSLATVVLVTDGAADDRAALDDATRALRASGVTLHVVGVGAERFDRDVEVADVHLPRRALRGDAVEAEIVITHRGLGGQAVDLVVTEEGAIVAEQPVELPADGPATLRVPLELTEAGPRRLAFRVASQAGETVMENNVARRLVDVRSEPVRVLHIEGEPRFEVKFLRRAVAGDDAIRLVSLVRTAENKYYRLGVENADELAGGLPDTDEALFRYDAVVAGSIDDALLDDSQQTRLRDFVARRGGGLVLLGGQRAFAEGGYAHSTLAGFAPVELPTAASAYQVRVPVRPAAGGRDDPLLRVASGNRDDTVWERLPRLTVVNPIRRAKPGATTILEGADGAGEPLVILAWQRYGRGTVAAFPVRDSWRWQMHADVPLEDKTHERLWRNLLRHVARPAGGRVRIHVESAEAALGDSVSVRAEVLDAAYRPATAADVTLAVTTPTGGIDEIPLERTVEDDGLHRASFVVREVGRHHLRVRADTSGAGGLHADTAVEVSGTGHEFHAAELDATRLERLAAATGGRFFRASEAAEVADAVDATIGTRRVERRLPLRDAPLLLALLLALACLEWIWRRRRDLA